MDGRDRGGRYLDGAVGRTATQERLSDHDHTAARSIFRVIETTAPCASQFSAKKVLYVEDNDLVREITAELLGDDGRHVTAFCNAEDALASFKTEKYDAVITDVSLPSMSGLDLTRAITALDPKAVVIVASGYSLDAKLHNFGPNVRCVTKPFEPLEVLALVETLLDQQSRLRAFVNSGD